MASVPLSTDSVSTSTPIQQNQGSRLGRFKRFITSPVKGIDVLSPIKRIFPFRRNLFVNDNATNNHDAAHVQLVNTNLVGVYNYKSNELSCTFPEYNNHKLDNDSGIDSDGNLNTSKESLVSFPTDENCNVIIGHVEINANSSCDLSTYLNTKYFNENELEYTKSLECLDKFIKPKINANEKQNQNSTSNLDILRELNVRNCFGVLSLILSHLPDEDLRKASYVSKEWQFIVFDDEKASERRKAYIRKKRYIAYGSEKENRFQSKSATERSHKSVFLSIINSSTEESQQPLSFNGSVGRFDSFIKEAQNLSNEEKLMKCPKCLYPSKAQSGNKYSCARNLCQHIFCKECMGPHFDNHQCSLPKLNMTVPRVKIGSRQSKKNLRRL